MHQNYIRGFDGLRAIAVIWVIFGHVFSNLNWPATQSYQKALMLVTNISWTGVQLFFVLSGFLITGILLKSKGSENQLRNFYIRRSLRIFPIYFLLLLVLFIIVPLLFSVPQWLEGPSGTQLWYWTYMQNWVRPFSDTNGFGHLWSLAIEEQYYLIWPLLVLRFNPKRLISICIFMVLSAPIFRWVLVDFFPQQWGGQAVGERAAYAFTFARWDAIALGSLLALLKFDSNLFNWLSKYCKFGVMGLGLIILSQIVIFHNFAQIGSGFALLNQTTVAVFFFFVVLFVQRKESNIVVSLLEWKPVKSMGKYSYAMYLIHLPILKVLLEHYQLDFENLQAHEVTLSKLLYFVVVIVTTYIVSMLSWKFFEYPILKYKKRFS